MKNIVLALFAHPDDAEFLCTGTLSLLSDIGWEVHIVTMTPGDKGTAWHSSEEISEIRKLEAAEAAYLIGAQYHCLGLEDVYIMYDRESINKAISLLRKIHPTVVLTHSPDDYMIDHEMCSRIAQTACFACGIKNMEVNENPFEPVPYLYYSDAMEGKDKLGNALVPSIYIDITDVIKIKEQMLACHTSQRKWLLEHHKMDEYILSMKRFSKQRGEEADKGYAEGFRQHLGHGYPHDNILKDTLGNMVQLKQ